ncbi:hypothetical protein HKCCSP123_04230 [Rhodobacterales bacterium HKCCSP123]|nr:hypothetical protein [Rhodobacterales bacterium HKCCSP123]
MASALALGAGAASAQATISDILAAAHAADIVILGEVHDNPAHHAMQADVLSGLSPSAIVFEMISSDEAALVTPSIATDAAALSEALDWASSGWPDFAFYAPLFAFGSDVPVYGAGVGREAAQGAFAQGAAAAFPGDAVRFGLDAALPGPEQAAREAEQMEAHCDALPEDILPGFVEAQRLRDAALAEAALDALAAHGPPVAVITGNGHARRDWGVPALLAIAAPDVTVFSLGQFEAQPEGEVPFDLWTLADPVDRPDPCAAFR